MPNNRVYHKSSDASFLLSYCKWIKKKRKHGVKFLVQLQTSTSWKKIVSFFQYSNLHCRPLLFLIPQTFCFRNNTKHISRSLGITDVLQTTFEMQHFKKKFNRPCDYRSELCSATVFGRSKLIPSSNRHNLYVWKLLQFFS